MNKNFVVAEVAHSHVKPSHFKDQFTYWMSNVLEWTDEIDGGNSFDITKIADLSPSQGNFHTCNHKVLYTTIIKKFSRWLQIQNVSKLLHFGIKCRFHTLY